MNEEKTMKTTDVWLAGYLLTKGAELVQLEKNPHRPSQVVILLEGENLKENAQTFTANGEVPLLSFKQLFLDLKHNLYRKNLNTSTRGRTDEGKRDF